MMRKTVKKVDFIKAIEILAVGLAGLGLGLRFLMVPNANMILVLSLTLLSWYYFLFSFILFNQLKFRKLFKRSTYINIKLLRLILSIIAGVVLSIIVLGILFRLIKWPGNEIQLTTGILIAIIMLLISLIRNGFGKFYFLKAIQIRLVIYITIGIFLRLTSIYWIENIKYRNYPEFLDLYKKRLENPNNIELKKEFEKAQKKMVYGEDYPPPTERSMH